MNNNLVLTIAYNIIRIMTILTILLTASAVGYSLFSRDLCISDQELKKPEIISQIRHVAKLFSRAGLPVKLSCDLTSIRLTVEHELSSPQAIGQTRINGLIRVVDGEQLFLPLLIPFWPIQEIKIRRDYVDTSYFKLILIHEIGHTLGIGHVLDQHNVMYPEIEPAISPTEAVEQVKELSYVKFK